MKKLLASLLFVSLLVPATASAADFSGVYFAPKIIGGIQQGKATTYIDSGNTHYSGLSRSFNQGVFGGGLAIGYNFAKTMDVPLRLELEYTAFTTASASANYVNVLKVHYKNSLQSLFVNAYFDINTGTNFTPYVGAGLGVGFNRLNTTIDMPTLVTSATLGSHSNTNFAWNVGLGVAYQFTDNIAVDLGYRYAQFGKGQTRALADATGAIKTKTNTIGMHQFVLAMRVTF